MAQRRLSRDERSSQLLDIAAALVRGQGADALTLGRLAEAAGVSRAVAYQHFQTRAGLLMALYRYLEASQSEAAQAALQNGAETLEDAVDILGAAYVNCGFNSAPELHGIRAALTAILEMDEFFRSEQERYAELYQRRLARFIDLPERDGKILLLAVIGGADVLVREVVGGRLTRAEAITTVRTLLLAAVRSAQRGSQYRQEAM